MSSSRGGQPQGQGGKSRYARKCVRLLSEDSAHFYNTVTSANIREAVLRAFFTVDVMSNEPVLKKSQAVSTSSLDPSFSDSLEQLRDSCNPKKQVVAWFTCENEEGALLDHGTAVLDKDTDEPVWEGVVHRPPSKAERANNAVSGGGGATPNNFRPGWDQRGRPISASRDGSPRSRVAGSSKLRSSKGHASGAASQSIDDMKREIISLSSMTTASPHRAVQASGSDGRHGSPMRGVNSGTRGGEFDPRSGSWDNRHDAHQHQGGGPTNVIGSSAMALNAFEEGTVQHQMNDLMNVCLLVSRATAKIAMSVDEAQARLDRLYDVLADQAAAQKYPREAFETLIYKVESLESQLVAVELALPNGTVPTVPRRPNKNAATETHPTNAFLHRASQTDDRVTMQNRRSNTRHVEWADHAGANSSPPRGDGDSSTIPATSTASRSLPAAPVVVEALPVTEVHSQPQGTVASSLVQGAVRVTTPPPAQPHIPLGESVRSPHDATHRVMKPDGSMDPTPGQVQQIQQVKQQLHEQQVHEHQVKLAQYQQQQQQQYQEQQQLGVVRGFASSQQAVDIPLRPGGGVTPHQYIDLSRQQNPASYHGQQQPQQPGSMESTSFTGTMGDFRGGEQQAPTAPHDPTHQMSHHQDPHQWQGGADHSSYREVGGPKRQGMHPAYSPRADDDYYNQPSQQQLPSVDASATDVTSRRHALPTTGASDARDRISRQRATAAFVNNSPSSTSRGPPRLR